jgi:hypothetical protein
MADYNTSRTAKPEKPKDAEDILAKAREDWDRAYERDQTNIDLAYEDLKFLSGDQWPEAQRKRMVEEHRPVLVDNRLPQFIHQITGDIRQMRPSIKVVPVDDGDERVADVYTGLVRYIENRSDASAIYFRGADSQVAAGIGHWRILTEYADEKTFNQEIRIGPIEDGVSVLWDPDSSLPTREDAKFCFVPVDVNRVTFEQTYPGVNPAAFDDDKWTHNQAWVTDDHVRLAEYWVKKPIKRTLALGNDGSIADITDADPSVKKFYERRGARIEERDGHKVCRYLITASAVLEGPAEWPGAYIPVVPVFGEEIRIGRKIIRKGIVRDAKDPQRMVNYFHSAHTEAVALQPKAPYMVTEINVAKYQPMWEQANKSARPYLIYTPDAANGNAAPQRIPPPIASQGISEGLALAVESLKAVTGIYDASLGARSNETSGKAIMARQREGDVGSYVYIDNFSRAVRYTGQILVDLIPHIYDTERTIRIMGEDGALDIIEINKAKGVGPDGKTLFENDLTVGSYDVVSIMGPSYTTKREEAKEAMLGFLQAAPQASSLVLDLVAKAQDWPMADQFAKRLRAAVPPQVLQAEELEKQGADPQQIQQMMAEANKPPPDPKIVAIQAKAEGDQQKLQLDAQQSDREFQIQMMEMQRETQRMIIDALTKIEVAQINAGIGVHKTIVDAATKQYGADVNAQVAAHKTEKAAETAKYAADNKAKQSEATDG